MCHKTLAFLILVTPLLFSSATPRKKVDTDSNAVTSTGEDDVNANVRSTYRCVECLWNCMHGVNMVQTKRGRTMLKHLNINDKVLSLDESTGRLRYDTVIFDLHHSPWLPANFVQIQTATGKEIMLTDKHYLYTGCSLSDKQVIAADAVRVGDAVLTSGAGGVSCEQVASINCSVPAVGVYNPVLAQGGTIVVGDILASVYASPGGAGVTPRAAHWALWGMRHIGRSLASYGPSAALLGQTGSSGVLLWARYMDILRGYAHSLHLNTYMDCTI